MRVATRRFITNTNPVSFSNVLLVNWTGVTVSDLMVRMGPGSGSNALQVQSGTVERVRVEAAAGATPSAGINQVGGSLRHVSVNVPTGVAGSLSNVTMEDATFAAPGGLFAQSSTARRVRIAGETQGLRTGSGTTRLEDSIVSVTGGGVGLATGEFSSSSPILSHVTLLGGGGAGGVGMHFAGGPGAFAAQVINATVRNTLVRGFARDVERQGYAGTGTSGCGTTCQVAVNLTVEHSALDLPVVDLGGPGAVTLGAGNLDAPDPRLVDATGGDPRPRFDSPLVDAGDPAGLGSAPNYLNESPLDALGALRVVDGAAGGTPGARRDIGALEYQRQAPSVALQISPEQPVAGQAVTFTVTGADPDADPLSFAVAVDGQETAGAVQTRSFGAAGTFTVRAIAVDPTGLAAVASRSLTVAQGPPAPPPPPAAGRCANRLRGGARADVLRGTPAGDDLRGLGGNDRLFGGDGADCLRGDAGRDRLSGGPGDDLLVGGTGIDVLLGEAGNDRLEARDGVRDVVNCGAGRDVAIVDRRDRALSCEVVRRR